ncbi:MAG: ferrous iron transporter B, partial [Clostridia bacterium]|nr:ferrous iron transporter B [Clostridia bacterium]
GWGFIKRAGTVILAASVVIWILNSLTFQGGFHYIGEGSEASILQVLGKAIAVIFAPLGFGQWEAAVATILGLVAKEEVVGVFGTLGAEHGLDAEQFIAHLWGGSGLAGMSFLIFNLLCAPCFAAMGAIKREMNNWKWSAGTIAYMCAFAYAISLIVYQLGSWFIGGGNVIGTVVAALILLMLIYLLVRPNPYKEGKKR